MNRPFLVAAMLALSACDCGGPHRTPPDAGPDAGTDAGPDAGPDAGDDAGTDAGPTTFLEDFLDGGNLDTSLTTALIDTATGTAYIPPRYAMETDLGDGGEGALSVDAGEPGDAAVFPLTPGTHQFASVDISGNMFLDADAGLTLLVQNDVHISNNANIRVAGPFKLVVGGAVRLDCGYIMADGSIVIHQAGDAGIVLDCLPGTSEIFTFRHTTGATGSIEIWTRGPVLLPNEGYISTGNLTDPEAKSGDLTIRAYGDIRVGDSDAGTSRAGNSYVTTGRNEEDAGSGNIELETEGAIFLNFDSYLISGDGHHEQPGTDITARTRGDVTLLKDSYFIAGASGNVTLVTEGALRFDKGSYFLNGQNGTRHNRFSVRARSLNLANDSYLIGGNTSLGGSTSISVEVNGDVLLDAGSSIFAGPGNAQPGTCPMDGGGATSVRAGGDVWLESAAGSSIMGGAGGDCAGGDATVLANGAITGADGILPGAGVPDGGLTIQASAGLGIGEPDAGLRVAYDVVSKVLPGQGTVISCSSTPAAFPGTLSFALDGGSDFTPADACAGKPLGSGYRYKASLLQRLFDGAAIDRITIEWQ